MIEEHFSDSSDQGLPHFTDARGGNGFDESTRHHREWKERVGSMSKGMVKQLATDERLAALGFDAFGMLLRVHMITRLGRSLPEDPYYAARILNTTRRRVISSMGELRKLVPELLILGHSGYTAPTLIASAAVIDPVLSLKRREAAMNRHPQADLKSMGLVVAQKKPKKEKAPSTGGHVPPASIASAVPVAGADAIPLQVSLFPDADTSTLDILQPAKAAKASKRTPIPECPFDEIRNLFNTISKATLPEVIPVERWTAARCSKTKNRWLEHPSLDFWRELFERVQRCEYLVANSAWRANYDWIMTPANLQKILEGNYDKPTGGKRELWGKGGAASAIGADSGMRSRVDAPFMQKTVKTEPPQEDSVDQKPAAPKAASGHRVDMAAPFMRNVAPVDASKAVAPISSVQPGAVTAPIVMKPVEMVQPKAEPQRIPFRFSQASGARK